MDVNGQNKSVVAKLRVRGEGLETVAARLHFERLFGASDFLTAGVPAKSIVCIKKISDPKPRSLRLNHGDLWFSGPWREAISKTVENLYRRAYRPIRETVPAQAEGVVFDDLAELLACLAADWRRGKLAENWWWQGLFPDLGRTRTVVKIWLEAAEFMPAAFGILAKTFEAAGFVQKLQPAETRDLLRQMVRVFGLQKLETALFASLEAKTVEEALPKASAKKDSFRASGAEALTKNDSMFGDSIREVKASSLSFEGRCLLEIGLLLARSPKTARSADFARRIELARLQNETGRTFSGKSTRKRSDQTAEFENRVKTRRETAQILRAGKPSPKKQQPETPKTEPRFSAERPRDEKSQKPSEKPEIELKDSSKHTKKISEFGKKTTSIEFEKAPSAKRFEELKPLPDKAKRPREGGEGVPKTPPAKTAFEDYFDGPETGIEFVFQTEFGGVFYLLNLGLYLGLYRDFTESPETELDLNIWDFVALLGLEFLGGKIKKDGLWDFLKRAAEREDDCDFGREFDRFRDWRVLPAWLETFSAAREWLWAKNKKRLVVRHAAGFNVLDVSARRGAAERQLESELEIYRNNFQKIVAAEGENLPRLKPRPWLENFAEYLEKRLFQALNVKTRTELNRLLFAQRATVSVSATHLEVTFALADLPVEVRLAGIDRDPAWIPAAGKFVYFHFV